MTEPWLLLVSIPSCAQTQRLSSDEVSVDVTPSFSFRAFMPTEQSALPLMPANVNFPGNSHILFIALEFEWRGYTQ